MKGKGGKWLRGLAAVLAVICMTLPVTAEEKKQDADKPAVVEKSAEQTPAADKPAVVEKSAEQTPAADKPAATEKSAEQTPAADKPAVVEKSAEQTPAADKPAATEKSGESAQTPKDNIATVNGVAITRAEFDKEIEAIHQRLLMQGQKPDEAQTSEIKNNVLDNLITRELLWQESQKSGVKITDSAVDEEIANWKKQFSDEAQFKTILASMNVSEEDLKAQMKQRLSVQTFLDKKLEEKIAVSDKEVKEYYDSHPDDFKQPEQVKASHILVKVDSKADEAGKAQARKKIEDIEKQVKKGEDFAVIAKSSSDCPSKENGGDLGYFSRGQMVKPFEDAAFALKTGEVSKIVETRFGYHLIKAVDKKADKTLSYDEVKDELKDYLKQQKKVKEIGDYSQELKGKAKIEKFLE